MSIDLAFGFILTLIILAFVLFFGSGTLNDLFSLSSEAQLANQIVEMQKIACGQARNNECSGGLFWRLKGDSENFKFNLPSGFSKVCFVDLESDLFRTTETWDGDDSISIDDIRINKYNIYAFRPSGNIGFNVPKLKPDQNLCIDKNRDLIITSRGQYVEVA